MHAARQRSLWDSVDITANRHGGNAESTAAFQSRDRDGDRALVLAFLRERGSATADEFAQHVGRPLNTVSGRFSELKASGLIEPTGERRLTRTGNTAGVFRIRGKA